MCTSLAEGGRRCAAHTRPAYEAATPGTPDWDDAAATYAATKEGASVLEAELAAASESGNINHVVACETAIKRAAGIRRAAAEVALRHSLNSAEAANVRDAVDRMEEAQNRGREVRRRWLREQVTYEEGLDAAEVTDNDYFDAEADFLQANERFQAIKPWVRLLSACGYSVIDEGTYGQDWGESVSGLRYHRFTVVPPGQDEPGPFEIDPLDPRDVDRALREIDDDHAFAQLLAEDWD